MSQDLLLALDRMLAFMDKHRVTAWASILREFREAIASTSPLDVIRFRHLLSGTQWFGGMGSLDDLVISAQNGHVATDEAAANQEYLGLLEELRRVMQAYRSRYLIRG